MSGPRRTSKPPRQLYFAYGSNLWLKQMAARCPNSYYLGRAILTDHCWQINERGYANIVPASGFTVHGLIYELGEGDEPCLDRSEGVSSGAYSKEYKSVILHFASSSLQIRTQWLVEDGGPERAMDAARLRRESVREWEACICPDILVYVSHNFVRRGQPRDEYIGRMNSGIKDALAMGIPEYFFDNTVRDWIPKSLVETHVNHRVSRLSHAAPRIPSSSEQRRSKSVSGEKPDSVPGN
ncbi:hypothetical protein HD806DRAFT_493397 [Xylariaceae sp. AK1471]|nr:hypothetical protein HD806DRAFT_493397 [Xylariaceae sp. AK1471]